MQPSNTPEEWRPVVGYEGLYEVSNRGNVRSKTRTVKHRRYGLQRISGMPRKQSVNADGYPVLFLSKGGVRRHLSVHRLVAEAFCARPEGATEVRHIDGNPGNNHSSNLQWGTRGENMRDRITHGTDRNAAKTHCINDHEFAPSNTRVTNAGHRVCKECAKESARRYRQKNVGKRANNVDE